MDILVVEDDGELRDVLVDLLVDEGHDVAAVENGAAALDHLRSHLLPQVILLDLFMPVMDGMEFLEEQRADAALGGIPVFLLTGRLITEGESGDAFGVAARFPKPLDLEMLRAALAEVDRPRGLQLAPGRKEEVMQLTSTAFSDGAEIPKKYTDDGEGVSPPLAWTDIPAGTRSLALVVDDPDAPDPKAPQRTWVHWVVADLRPDSPGLPEGVDRVDGQIGMNDWKHARWDGPAPPAGRHRYFFKLYALDSPLGLEHPTKADLEQGMKGHVLAEAKLIGTYQRAS